MNVLYLSQEYPPETGGGGIGIYTRNIAHTVAEMGHTVHVLSSAVPPRETYHYTEGAVHLHRARRWKSRVPVIRRLWFRYLTWTTHQWEYILGVRGEIDRIVREHSIDLIEAPDIWAEGLLYSFQRRVPIVVKLQGSLRMTRRLNNQPETRDWRVVGATDGWWVRRADSLISAGRELAELGGREYGVPAERFTVISNPVDTRLFVPASNGKLPTPTILYVGRIEPRKGVYTIARAMRRVLARVPDARFVFLGSDYTLDGRSCRQELLAEMNDAGVASHAQFLGFVPNSELPRYYQESTVCVFPSRWEPLGIVCLEAMACARPVVASRAGGMAEIVQDGENGLLVPPDDPAALADSLAQVLESPEVAHEWGIRAREHVERYFSNQVVARMTLRVYDETLDVWKRNQASR